MIHELQNTGESTKQPRVLLPTPNRQNNFNAAFHTKTIRVDELGTQMPLVLWVRTDDLDVWCVPCRGKTWA